MARPKTLKPAYCLHKSSGRAYVTIDGKTVYLGTHGTQESRDQYDRVIGEWIGRGRTLPTPPESSSVSCSVKGPTINVLAERFWTYCQTYYVDRDGNPSDEATNFKYVLGFLVRMYGTEPAAEFGPLKLKAIREAMIQPRTIKAKRRSVGQDGKMITAMVNITTKGWSRRSTNKAISRLKRVFAWGIENELIDAARIEKGKVVAITPSQRARAERAANRERVYSPCYSKDGYVQAVKRACRKAKLASYWTPNRLRHSAATKIRDKFGLEAAQVALGHTNAKVTEVYAERNSALARRVAAEVG